MLEKSNLNGDQGVVLCNAPVIWPPPPLPGMVMVGTFTQCECESQWSSQTLGQKYWVNSSPPLGTQLYKPKSCVCRLWQPILNLLARPWRAIPNEDNMLWAMQIIYVKCSNYQVAWKCDRWQIKCESPTHTWPVGRRNESEHSPHLPGKHKLVNMRWLSLLSPCYSRGGGGGGGGGGEVKWLVHNQLIV